MLVTSCPRCHESVRIPDRLLSGQVATTAQVQCPWCLATLDQQEIESAMPPALIVIGDDLNAGADPLVELETLDSDDEEPAALGGFALDSSAPELESQSSELGSVGVMEESADVSEAETMDSESFEAPAETSTEEDDLDEFIIPENKTTAEVGGEPEVAPMAIYTSDKKRRKKKSLIKTVGSPILGALLALPVGGGLLWYLDALPNLGFYPLDGTYSSSSNPVRRSAAAPGTAGGYVPPILEDSPEGRSLGEDLDNGSGDDTATPEPVELDTSETDMVPANDPASEALAELSGTPPTGNEAPAGGDAEMPTEPPQQSPSEEPAITEVAKPPVEPTVAADDAPVIPPVTDAVPTEEEPLMGLPGLPPAVDTAPSDSMSLPTDPLAIDEPTSETADANLNASVDEIDTVLNRLEDLDVADPKYGQAVAFAYGMLSRLSAETSPDNYDQLQPLVDRIKSNKNLFVSFAKQVPAWVSTPQEERQTDGAFVLGKFIAAEATDGYAVRLLDGNEYPVTFADGVEAKTVTAVALGSLDASEESAAFEINWIQPAQ
ncbi:hypothetical protein [Rhodopirellula bahusiensis]|uniref:Uncharacterized protein n=1 Tax=Rhodopirellula bahusiensis TaxID=2014065 RepID=A0A2G1WA43_9BACT|nr:hypothetical protein [Rhodopirellula bahusiensis]PHQ35893.1 hypothetical protein CEE69_06695 [Rhodopirellula bahusiensis]